MKKLLLLLTAGTLSLTQATAQNPLPNAGFETWNDYSGGLGSTYREPQGWNTANQCSQLVGTYSVTRSGTAHSGSYAAELKTRNAFIGSIRINGLMTTSQIICGTNTGGQEGGIASDLIPDSIAFWYKYAPVDVDTAYVQVILFSGTDTASIAKGKIHAAAADWTRAAFAIPTPTATPTVISTLFNSSWGDGSQGQAFVNSTFTVDDVEFIFATGVQEHDGHQGVEVYPNPVADVLNIRRADGGAAVMEILDATGRTVVTRDLIGMNSSIDLSHLPAGVYLFQLRGVGRQVLRTGRFVKGL